MDDFKKYFGGFFGHPEPPVPPRDPNLYPPPPPIPEFSEDYKVRAEEDKLPKRPMTPDLDREQPMFPRGGFLWGKRPIRPREIEEELERGQFVFSDMFAVVGEMFQEMERSMRDMDQFFGSGSPGPMIEGNMVIPYVNPNQGSHPQSTPPENSTTDLKKEDNLRDLVLKESETAVQENPITRGSYNGSKHYLPQPEDPSDKIDRDLDQLYEKSMLDLSELPVPSKRESQQHTPPTDPQRPGTSQGSLLRTFSQRTYQTHTFRNGRMEGEIVKEDETGRHVTKYFQDDNGNRQETVEFFPRDGSQPVRGPEAEIAGPLPMAPFAYLFDRVFRPRM